MMKLIVFLHFVFCLSAFAVPCDCEVRVHSPLTGSYKMAPVVIETYQLEHYSFISRKSIRLCQNACLKAFQKDMPANRLNALLETYSMQLIEQKTIGHNCTGLTTLKFPVRVRALLDDKGLGNVADIVQVINHEKVCF
jgi:hypothetical protein